jgi:hypothetical protein
MSMATLLSSGYQPFVIAGLLMAGLVLIETLSLILGFSLSLLLDHGFDVDGPVGPDAGPTGAGLFGSALGWLNAGRVPVLVLLIAWLAAFAAVGFFIQTLSGRLFVPLPTLVAVVISGGLGPRPPAWSRGLSPSRFPATRPTRCPMTNSSAASRR